MHETDPKVFIVAETTGWISSAKPLELDDYLIHVDAPAWETDAPSDIEELIEVQGRSCYKSFHPDLNDNLTKVREGNKPYLANVIASKHGSVLEHASATFMFCDVSRVFTHELVRHRQGTAISQESLRYVRLNDLGVWAPSVIREDQAALEVFTEAIERIEDEIKRLTSLLIDDSMPFSEKKIITSAIRRIAPMGLSTNIGWTANMRTLRFVLDLRTHPSAEEEIRLVFNKVGDICLDRWPNLFQDFERVDTEDGLFHFKSEHWKV